MSSTFVEEARRAQIVAAATEVVAELGYAQASLARIAEHAGISKSVISYHFDGKSDLLEEVVKRYLDATWAHMEAALTTATSPAERLRTWGASQMAAFAADRTGFLAMVDIVTSHRREDGSRPFEGIDEQETEELARMLDDGQRTGEFRPLDSEAVAQVIAQTMEGALTSWAYGAGGDLDHQIPALVDFIMHAVEAAPS